MLGKPFYDRERELRELDRFLGSWRSELVLVYGRRGVGKSRLLEEMLASATISYGRRGNGLVRGTSKNASWTGYRAGYRYTATERVLAQQLDDMVRALLAPPTAVAIAGRPQRFEDLLDILGRIADEQPGEPFTAIFDEFPYLARSERGLLTAVQRWWNENKTRRRNFKLFLAGSNVSFMEREALAEDAALKSVRTGKLEVTPLTYRGAGLFYPHLEPVERVAGWAVWGGLPGNLEELDQNEGLWQNIERTTLRSAAKLYKEPEWLQYTELRTEAIYASIVRAVASGERTPSDIARAVGRKSASEITPYLTRLIQARMLERRASMTADGERERTAQYVVADPFHAYWYRFVDPFRTLLDRGHMSPVLEQLRDPERGLDKYISEQPFEDACRSFLLEALGARRLPPVLRFQRLGSWWRATGDRSDELDVVAYRGARLVALGECKWRKEPAGMAELAKLDRVLHSAADELRPDPVVFRILFSRSGFERELRQKAADPDERVLLFEPKDLYW